MEEYLIGIGASLWLLQKSILENNMETRGDSILGTDNAKILCGVKRMMLSLSLYLVVVVGAGFWLELSVSLL